MRAFVSLLWFTGLSIGDAARLPKTAVRNLRIVTSRKKTGEDVAMPYLRDVGPDLFQPLVARGAAYADYDRDGDLDIAVTTNDDPARLFRNGGGNASSYLSIDLQGTSSDRDGIGAVVRVASSTGEHWALARTGASYCSQSALTMTFGLRGTPSVDRLDVVWPSGRTTTLSNLAAGERVSIRE